MIFFLLGEVSHLGDTVGKHGLPRTLTSTEGREFGGKILALGPFFLFVRIGVTQTTMSAYPCVSVGPINTG